MPIMEISILPVGTHELSISRYIADSVMVLRERKDVIFEITAMGTIIEASSIDILLDLAKKMHQVALQKGTGRVLTTIKIDDRTDKKLTIERKVEAVREKL